MERIHDEYDQYRVGGPGVPIRCVRVGGGTLAVCGDGEQLDRRGRQTITYATPDRRLVLLGVEDEVDVPGVCAAIEHAPLAEIEPYSVHYRGEQRYFQATYKPFLLGVCDLGDSLVLLGGIDGGLAFLVGTQDGWTYVLERDWGAHVDLDARLGGESSSANPNAQQGRREPAQREQAQSTQSSKAPGSKARGKARRADNSDEELQEHYMRLTAGLSVQPRGLEILAIAFAQLVREAMLPHANFAGNYKGREHLSMVADGLLRAIASGCGNLGGREMDMRTQLRAHGVVMPRGALSGVLRLFHLLGCPIISQPKPVKGRDSSRLWNIDVLGALDPTSAKHLALLRSIPTPIRKAALRQASQPGETPCDAETHEPRVASDRGPSLAAPAGTALETSARPDNAATSDDEPGETTGEQTTKEAAAVTDTTGAESAASVQALVAILRFTVSGVCMLAERVTMLQEQFTPTARNVGEDPLASTPGPVAVRADPPMHTADGATDGQPDHDARAEEAVLAQHDAVLATGNEAAIDETQRASHQATKRIVAASPPDKPPCSDAGPDPDLGPHVDAGPRYDAGAASMSPHTDVGPIDSAGPDPAAPKANVVPDRVAAEWALTLDRWNFATVVFMVIFEIDDPTLVWAVVRNVIAWTAAGKGRVDLTGEKYWPRALCLSNAGHLAGLACTERLKPTQAWVPAYVECVDTGPRGRRRGAIEVRGSPREQPKSTT